MTPSSKLTEQKTMLGNERGIHIAVIGDVHLQWNADDVSYFNDSDYDLVLFVGDIAEYSHRSAIKVAREISRLTVPTLVIPGNHDTAHVGQLFAEVFQQSNLSDGLSFGQVRRNNEFDRALGRVTLAGYSRHSFCVREQKLSIIAARPHSMGGPRLTYRKFLRKTFQIHSLEESAQRVKELVDQCGDEPLVFLGHNGPSGLGEKRTDVWGCDFRPAQGDYGDPDLREAIEHARKTGKHIAAVIAGHMHHTLIGGGERRWSLVDGDLLYLNAARVPRIEEDSEGVHHHHMRVVISRGVATFTAEKVSLPSNNP